MCVCVSWNTLCPEKVNRCIIYSAGSSERRRLSCAILHCQIHLTLSHLLLISEDQGKYASGNSCESLLSAPCILPDQWLAVFHKGLMIVSDKPTLKHVFDSNSLPFWPFHTHYWGKNASQRLRPYVCALIGDKKFNKEIAADMGILLRTLQRVTSKYLVIRVVQSDTKKV